MTCPKSEIDSLSVSWIEQYSSIKLFGGGTLNDLPAKCVDALFIIDGLVRQERSTQK
jgi:hypothetical protein